MTIYIAPIRPPKEPGRIRQAIAYALRYVAHRIAPEINSWQSMGWIRED